MFGLTQWLKVIDPTPVLIDHQACLPARHRRSTCRACIEVCPESVLALEGGKVGVNSSACSLCGLCAGTCPTGAVTIRGIDERVLTLAPELRCREVGGSACLGWLTADHLLEIGMARSETVLTTGDCSACRLSRAGAMIDRAAATANTVLEQMGQAQRIQVSRQVVRAGNEGRALSRRDLFSLWRTEGVQVASTLLPQKEVNPAKLSARVPPRRARWIRRAPAQTLNPGAVMPEGPWSARKVSDACTGCGICVAFCPTGALTQVQEGENWTLSHQPTSCVNCDTCSALCPTRAVGQAPLTIGQMVSGERTEVAHLVSAICNACRKPFKGPPGQTRCPVCRSMMSIVHN